jgi:hypothetical protein
VTVNVDVDELTDVEVAHFEAHGTAAQWAEMAAYFAPVSARPLRRCSVAPSAAEVAA